MRTRRRHHYLYILILGLMLLGCIVLIVSLRQRTNTTLPTVIQPPQDTGIDRFITTLRPAYSATLFDIPFPQLNYGPVLLTDKVIDPSGELTLTVEVNTTNGQPFTTRQLIITQPGFTHSGLKSPQQLFESLTVGKFVDFSFAYFHSDWFNSVNQLCEKDTEITSIYPDLCSTYFSSLASGEFSVSDLEVELHQTSKTLSDTDYWITGVYEQ